MEEAQKKLPNIRMRSYNTEMGIPFNTESIGFNQCHRKLFYDLHRMTPETFDKLMAVGCMRSKLSRNPKKRRRMKVVTPPMRLSILLRYLAGDRVQALESEFRIGKSTVYHVVCKTMKVVLCQQELKISFPWEDKRKLLSIAAGFKNKFVNSNLFERCVGAVDGYAFRIRKPKVELNWLPELLLS